ncbi:MAG: adenylate/guanylate cyclase domain-containing protein [Myxococcales bacterium]|nr:MAG: adenylate/guanylate cyclase domain-containing protein [Myxococcales bacterium]
MTPLPETKYASSGDISIAYQVMGDGPLDLVVVPGFVSHVEFLHELPGYTRWIESMASFARVIRFDKRGGGLSDPVSGAPSLEERIDDVRAVMDAVGSENAALLGWSEGAPLSVLFAATYPQRTSALILLGGFPRILQAADYLGGMEEAVYTAWTEEMVENWGSGATLDFLGPSVADNDELRVLWGEFERLSANPGALRAMWALNRQIDIRAVLPQVRVPTLVVHRREDTLVPIRGGRLMASQIPGAKLVEPEGRDHRAFIGDIEGLVAEVEEFLTGTRQITPTDRVLATVLFTDIVASTQQAAELGDRRWRRLLDSHDEMAAGQVKRFRGRMIKTTGDGILATFDGPPRAINCAGAIRDGARALGLETRAGLHIGEIELLGDDIGGIAVHITARVLEKAAPGEVVVSRTLTDLVAGSGLRFEDRGEHGLKGVAEKWYLFAAAVS